jgi:hypothetical protein
VTEQFRIFVLCFWVNLKFCVCACLAFLKMQIRDFFKKKIQRKFLVEQDYQEHSYRKIMEMGHYFKVNIKRYNVGVHHFFIMIEILQRNGIGQRQKAAGDLIVDFGKQQNIVGFKCLRGQGSPNEIITGYKLSVSDDDQQCTLISEGDFF